MKLCAWCETANRYQFDLASRCCRARSTALLLPHRRQREFDMLRQAYGEEWLQNHVADVIEYAGHLSRIAQPRPPLTLCPVCQNGNLYEINMENRCCRARLSLMSGRDGRIVIYAWMQKHYGETYLKNHIDDVKTYYRISREIPENPITKPILSIAA